MFAGEKLATLASELRLSPKRFILGTTTLSLITILRWSKFLLLELRFLYVGPN